MIARSGVGTRRPVRFGEVALVTVVGLTGSTVVVLGMTQQAPLHLISAALAVLAFLIVGVISPRRLILLIVAWLLALGATRRLLLVVEPQSPYDSLLLVGPAGLMILALLSIKQGAFRQRTPLANAALVLVVLTLVGAANPLQGSLLTGVAGLEFSCDPGQEVDLPEATARVWADGRRAVLVPPAGPASNAPPRRKVGRGGRKMAIRCSAN